EDIAHIESQGTYEIQAGNEKVLISLEDVEIMSEDIPGWLVANEGSVTVALDITVTDELRHEGIAREFINRIQNLRKDSDFEVTDKINLRILKNDAYNEAVLLHQEYISNQTLAASLVLVETVDQSKAKEIDIDEINTFIEIEKQA
ncbi:MAG: DUF5915 domain-containing protein, partial [Bacteroidota bacterium]|nr:DUF5915 domain-containing protein [Bacteroidota bacterium]